MRSWRVGTAQLLLRGAEGHLSLGRIWRCDGLRLSKYFCYASQSRFVSLGRGRVSPADQARAAAEVRDRAILLLEQACGDFGALQSRFRARRMVGDPQFHWRIQETDVDVPAPATKGKVTAEHEGDQCAIRIEELSVGDDVPLLRCLHKFHEVGLMGWLRSGGRLCPVCREPHR